MSLDIHLTDRKTGEEVQSMNWLRNQYGLCNWAEDNVEFATKETPKERESLWYAVNHWSYDKSSRVNRPLFKEVVDRYAAALLAMPRWYFFFDGPALADFVAPHWQLIPQAAVTPILPSFIRPEGAKVLAPSRLGIPIEHLAAPCFNLGSGDMKDKYRRWLQDLVDFAERLQDRSLRFYCSN